MAVARVDFVGRVSFGINENEIADLKAIAIFVFERRLIQTSGDGEVGEWICHREKRGYACVAGFIPEEDDLRGIVAGFTDSSPAGGEDVAYPCGDAGCLFGVLVPRRAVPRLGEAQAEPVVIGAMVAERFVRGLTSKLACQASETSSLASATAIVSVLVSIRNGAVFGVSALGSQ